MAIHFRTEIVNQQIKATVSGAADSGWCCGLSAVTARADCQGYYFILGANNANGCPAQAGCPQLLVGEIPGACCYWKNENGTYVQRCGSVETSEACNALHEGFDEGLQYSFYPGQYCENDGGNVVCNGVKRVYGDDTGCNPDDATNCFDPNNLLGNCCHNPIEGKVCTISTKAECGNGVWSPPKNGAVMSCIRGAPCDGVYFSGPLNYPTTTTIEQVTNSTSEIEKLPQIGDYYQGGIFVGIFNPGTPINSNGGSMVFGNPSTGNASDYRARAGVGYGRTGWILIADLEDHVADSDYTGINLFDNIPFMSSNIISDTFVSSTYDGLYNTIENTSDLYSKITSHVSNGFTDWYLPSQDELALYFKNIKPDTQLFNGYSIPQGSYLTSTLFSLGGQRNFNGAYFNYTQQATTDSYGKVNLLPVTEKARIKLFRRIYLGSEISSVIEPETCAKCIEKAWEKFYKDLIKASTEKRRAILLLEKGIIERDNPDGTVTQSPGGDSMATCFNQLFNSLLGILLGAAIPLNAAMVIIFGLLGIATTTSDPVENTWKLKVQSFNCDTGEIRWGPIEVPRQYPTVIPGENPTQEEVGRIGESLKKVNRCSLYKNTQYLQQNVDYPYNLTEECRQAFTREAAYDCQTRLSWFFENPEGVKIAPFEWVEMFRLPKTGTSGWLGVRAAAKGILLVAGGTLSAAAIAAITAGAAFWVSAALLAVLFGLIYMEVYLYNKCIEYYEQQIDIVKKIYNGDSNCRDKTGKCDVSKCTLEMCIGKIGKIRLDYRNAIINCCKTTACLNEPRDKKMVCTNPAFLPPDPTQKNIPEEYTPGKPVLEVPRETKVTLGDAFNAGTIIA